MTATSLRVERRKTTLHLTLDSPATRNALDAALVENCLDVLGALTGDTRLVVISGEGPAFCSGFDFSGFDDVGDAELAQRFVRIEQLLQLVYHLPVHTLALAQGSCFGAGADLFAACTWRVATPDCRFRFPGLRFGAVLGTRRLVDVVGGDAAREVLSSSPVFDTRKAELLGLVQRVLSLDEWPDAVQAFADEARCLSPDAQQALLRHTRTDSRDADLASLTRSVSGPGLKGRMRHFLEESRRAARSVRPPAPPP